MTENLDTHIDSEALNMADMVVASRLLAERQVACDLAPLALGADALVAVGPGVRPVVDDAAVQQAVVLAVGDDELAQRLGAQHRLAHQRVVLYAVPVVG